MSNQYLGSRPVGKSKSSKAVRVAEPTVAYVEKTKHLRSRIKASAREEGSKQLAREIMDKADMLLGGLSSKPRQELTRTVDTVISRAKAIGTQGKKGSGQLLETTLLSYTPGQSDAFASAVNSVPPMQLLEAERLGVDAIFLEDMARRMHVSYSYLAETLGISKATAARKLANKDKIDGSAAIALARLLAIAQDMVDDSTSPDAKGFDAAKWLGQWIERPQASLGGRKPAELLDTPTGVSMVIKLLGAIRSGAYQ